jgi:hypothetical protein
LKSGNPCEIMWKWGKDHSDYLDNWMDIKDKQFRSELLSEVSTHQVNWMDIKDTQGLQAAVVH